MTEWQRILIKPFFIRVRLENNKSRSYSSRSSDATLIRSRMLAAEAAAEAAEAAAEAAAAAAGAAAVFGENLQLRTSIIARRTPRRSALKGMLKVTAGNACAWIRTAGGTACRRTSPLGRRCGHWRTYLTSLSTIELTCRGRTLGRPPIRPPARRRSVLPLQPSPDRMSTSSVACTRRI